MTYKAHTHYNYQQFGDEYLFTINDVVNKCISSFDILFLQQNCKKEIEDLIILIKENKTILDMDSDYRNFSTIFLPFMPEYFTQAQDYNKVKLYVHIKLVEFMNLCKDIEMLTDEYPLLQDENKEPSDQDKKKLLSLLERFLQILPNSLDEFKSWMRLEK